ncbi:MAG: hypothetical protein ACPL7C_06950 [Anaerolineae bacterium]
MERGNSLIGFTVVIALIALFLGLALANTDVLNPYRGPAQAEAMKREAEIQAERERLALEIRRQEEQIRLEGERQRQETERALMKFAGTVLTVALAVAILMLAYGATVWMIARARQIATTSLPTPSVYRAISQSRPVGSAYPMSAAAPAYAAASERGGNGRQPVNFPDPAI